MAGLLPKSRSALRSLERNQKWEARAAGFWSRSHVAVSINQGTDLARWNDGTLRQVLSLGVSEFCDWQEGLGTDPSRPCFAGRGRLEATGRSRGGRQPAPRWPTICQHQMAGALPSFSRKGDPPNWEPSLPASFFMGQHESCRIHPGGATKLSHDRGSV